MHPALRPNLSVPLTIVSVAAWSAAAVTVATVPATRNNAPLLAAADPEPIPAPIVAAAFAAIAPPPVPFDERFSAAAGPLPKPVPAPPAVKPAEALDYAQADAERRVRHARAETRDICARHGMHKMTFRDRPGHMSWRCRR